jgi:CubicO group peptidase (beta-lactamase class C family)
MQHNQVGNASTDLLGPGAGFGFGGAVLLGPIVAGSPQSVGTWYWSGVYGHRWYVDPTSKLTVVALTNTAPEGHVGQFTIGLRNAVYGGSTPVPDSRGA